MNVLQLNLRNCHLVSIGPGAFEYLPNLEKIDFLGNTKLLQPFNLYQTPFLISIQSINSKTFRQFGLSKTDIFYSPYFIMLPFWWNLEALDLSYNAFNLLGHITDILAWNFFPPMRNLKSINLKASYISSIHFEAFKPLQNIQIIDLSQNNLMAVPMGVLQKTVKHLDMGYQNGPFNLHPNVFNASHSIQKLILSGNRFHSVAKEALFGLFQAEELYMSDCPLLSSIEDGAFLSVPNLKKLDLSHNTELVGLTNGTLIGLANLEELNLAFSSFAFSNDTSGMIIFRLSAYHASSSLCALYFNSNMH